jgi:tetratricopeptide (TPR) repeat protein
MKKILIFLLPLLIAALLFGCSRDSAEKIRYDMEKLVYMAGKIQEKLNIQPQLATAEDSLALKSAYEMVIDYFHAHRSHHLVAGNEEVLSDMSRMAVGAQLNLAGYYTARRQADSVIAAYRKIGNEIPAGDYDIAAANLALALTYRAINVLDSTIAIYDRLLEDFYPPLDSLERVNIDIVSIPIDKVKIGQAVNDPDRVERFTREAIDYYGRLQREYPDNKDLIRRTMVNSSRIFTMTEKWDEAIEQLYQIKDSTDQVDIAALVLVANIYNGPKSDVTHAMELHRRILDREPDSSIIGSTMLQLGTSLCSEGEHEEGRKVLAELKKKFVTTPALVSKSQFYYAQSFEVQGRWDRALSEYQWLMENHPYTEEAFWAARRIPEHFSNDGNKKMSDTWYNRAADFYLRAANIKQGQPLEIAAYTYLAEIYRITEQWDKAIETLEKINSLVPRSVLAAKSLYNAAEVSLNKKGDSLQAQKYLTRLQQEFGTVDTTQIYQEEKKTDINLESLE